MTEPMDADDFKALQDLLKDAEACGRLSNWDEAFLADLRDRVLRYGDRVRLSGKQNEVLKRIEEKVYAT